MGDKSQPKGGHGRKYPWMRKITQAFFSSLRDQKKLVRSMVLPNRVPEGWSPSNVPMRGREDNEKVGFGVGERRLAPRRSAINAAFSDDLGRRKALKLSWVG